MILPCSCSHSGQDSIHGYGRRVHNLTKTSARCTVCKSEKGLSQQQLKDKNEKDGKRK